MESYTYWGAADQAFNRLLNLTGDSSIYVAPGNNGFWQQGNALSTCLDYLLKTGKMDNGTDFERSIVRNAIDNVFVKYLSEKKLWPIDASKLTSQALNGKDPWLDDYGWWGIALQKAHQFSDRLGYDKQFSDYLLTLSTACWEALCGGWDEEVRSRDDISGGAWNCKEPDWSLTGRNCVTNELLWLLSQNLHRSVPDNQRKRYIDQISRSQRWFSDAHNNGILLSKDGLVLERFKGMENAMSDPDWSWAGDQGLFTAACVGNKVAGGDDMANIATDISTAVESALMDKDNVIHDHNPPCDSWDSFIQDYATGKGVYLRCWSSWRDKKSNQLILANARAVWINRNPSPDKPFKDPDPSTKEFQFGFNWNPNGRPYVPDSTDPKNGEPNYLYKLAPDPTDPNKNKLDGSLGVGDALRFSLLILQVSGMAALNAALPIADKEMSIEAG